MGRSFTYLPLLSRDVLRRAAVKELVDTLFDGSERELAAYLAGTQHMAAAASAGAGATAATDSSDDSLDTTLL